ncbi:MAG: four helix bundle protein [Candidatus Moranbacteria bacterium CG10_big_fil_rev_8_21_14_0_10_35_21]|nr:MAG: four helix bundle protein [Candidatus Moranbacteria bacterium CG10_big_fil_rev_8_21_14_0_10_35_21]
MKKNDIGEGSFCFGVRIIKMVSALSKNIASDAVGKQVVRSGTSIGANIAEAQGAVSKKEFVYHMNIAKKEARETLFWLRIICEAELISENKLKNLIDENNQIIAILVTIVKTSQKKDNL